MWPWYPSGPLWSLDTLWSWKAPLSWNSDGKWKRTLVAWDPTKTCSTEGSCYDPDKKHKSTYLVSSISVYFMKAQNLPGGPVFPFGPSGPLSPFTPITPGVPINPCSPFTPVRKAYQQCTQITAGDHIIKLYGPADWCNKIILQASHYKLNASMFIGTL